MRDGEQLIDGSRTEGYYQQAGIVLQTVKQNQSNVRLGDKISSIKTRKTANEQKGTAMLHTSRPVPGRQQFLKLLQSLLQPRDLGGLFVITADRDSVTGCILAVVGN